MLGALYHYLRSADADSFQPMNSNFGLVAPLAEHVRDKGARRNAVVDRAGSDFTAWMVANDIASSMIETHTDDPLVADLAGGE
jgi:methylenetetrahydrofolate--tRNA-(uracil-5-)-methyltransferase